MENFYVLNTIQTNNFADKDLGEKIGTLWQKANEKIGEKQITLYAIYHSYASDYKGDYSLSIATQNIETENKVTILDDKKFEVFEVTSGKLEDVFPIWQKIWQLEENGQLNRTYEIDYEKYNCDGKIEIYIGVE